MNQAHFGRVRDAMNRMLARCLLVVALSSPLLAAAQPWGQGEWGRRGRDGHHRWGHREPSANPYAAYGSCQSAFVYDSDVQRCVQLVSRLPVDGTGLVNACSAAMTYASDKLRCLELAGSAGVDLSRTVTACDAAMTYDSDVVRCVQQAVSARRDLSGAVQSCDAAMTYDSDVLRCVQMVAVVPACHDDAAARIVSACDAALTYDSDTLRCVEKALPLGWHGAEVVGFCDQARTWDSQVLSCIDGPWGEPVARGDQSPWGR